jgi:hypothetical protein
LVVTRDPKKQSVCVPSLRIVVGSYQLRLLLALATGLGVLDPVVLATAPFNTVGVGAVPAAGSAAGASAGALLQSAAAVQLAGPQTCDTPDVPSVDVNAVRRESVQKQLLSTLAVAGGAHPPCTS